MKSKENKNRDREHYSFANINILGKCNLDCYFCLGKDIEKILSPFNHTKTHWRKWENFGEFISLCKKEGITKIYITGQNTDSLLYSDIDSLVDYLQDEQGFGVGLRTNGYLAREKIGSINKCSLETGYTINSLDSRVNKMITGKDSIPPWDVILGMTYRPRVQVVINRCNKDEFFNIIRFVSKYKNVQYVQARKVSTDTRKEFLEPDQSAYEEVYTSVSKLYELKNRLWEDAEVYEINGVDVCFWRTVRTSVNSMNYFTDGTISPEYFVIEGYLKNARKPYTSHLQDIRP